MGVYIDMEMPKSTILFCIHPDGKVFVDLEGRWREYKAILIQPHGRLIDADALAISTAVPIDGKPYQYVHIDNIKASPTIIPAEIISENEIKIIDTKGKSNYDPKRRFVIMTEEDKT